jgi:hypothetical protein
MSDQLPEPKPAQTDSTHRRGKARERIRRRRERAQSQSNVQSAGKRVRRHLSPAGAFEMPAINARLLRTVVLIAGAVLFMFLIILGVGLLKNDPNVPDPNGFWLGSDWTYVVHDNEQIDDLVSQLHEHRIGEIYAHVSELNFDGTWTGLPDQSNQFDEVENRVTALVQGLHERYPDLTIYGVVNVRSDLDEDGYRLDDEDLQEEVSDFSARVVNSLGFDGVLLNVQPVWNDDEHFLDLLRVVRDTIGDDARLAVMTPPDWTPTDADVSVPSNIAPGTVWTQDFKRRVALLQVDQIVLRAFESYFSREQNFSSTDYADWLAYQVATYAEAIAYLENNTRLVIAVSTEGDVRVQETLVVRDESVETLQAAIDGVIRGLELAGDDASVFQGIALYSSKDTDASEWRQFKNLWVER